VLSFRNTAAAAAAQPVTVTVQPRAWLARQYSSASRQMTVAFGVVILFVGMASGQDASSATDSKKVQEALKAIRSVQINGGNHAEAQAAVKVLGGLPSTELPTVLKAFEGASPLAKNWLMGVAGSLVRQADKIPVASLESFLSDTQNDVDARYWAFELLTQQDAAVRNKWLAAMTEDPCLEIRYLAVAQKLEQLDATAVDAAAYSRLLDQARHPEQLKAITAKLRDAGEGVDLARQYGFVMAWDLIGPFDNRGEKGFDIAYDPEKAYLANPAARPTGPYLGKEGVTCNWVPLTTVADDGLLDVAPVYNKEKGAIAYAFTEFQADDAVPADIRLGCINANKVWVNGREISSNQIYHASSSIDQYIGKVELKKGSNTILIKICQNEMTQAWAQDWSFQLRVCDATGKAILASGRPVVAVKKTETKADEQK
jgi:hypothetical protein